MEIEKKYAIKTMPENLENYEKKVIEQGYLCTKPVVRIRQSNEDYILTFKSKADEAENKDAIMNHELEVPLNQKAYLHLREKIDGRLIRKTRYLIPLDGNLTAELDVFEGELKGLCFAEVEFHSGEEAKKFTPPAWFGKEVTFDKHYRNSYLAKVESLC